MYSESDIFLIDDALSALDAYVGKKVMDTVFCGEMAGKTRVMVTHHLSHLDGNVNKIILLTDGKIVQSGNIEVVKKTQEYLDFSNSEKKDQDNKLKILSIIEEVSENHVETLIEEKRKSSLELMSHSHSQHLSSKSEIKGSNMQPNSNIYLDAGKITAEESNDQDAIGIKYYLYYIRSAGIRLSVLTLFLFALSVGLKISTDWWVGVISEQKFNLEESDYL